MVFTDHVLVFLVLWGAAGFGALMMAVLAIVSLARQLNRTAVPSVRVAEPDDALAA